MLGNPQGNDKKSFSDKISGNKSQNAPNAPNPIRTGTERRDNTGRGLEKTNSLDYLRNSGTLPPVNMGIEGISPTNLHQQLESKGAYGSIEDSQRRGFLQTFLTTPKSMRDIARETNGQWSVGGVRNSLYTSMRRVFPLLPQETRQALGSAEEAIKKVAADEAKVEARRRKMRENERPGWKEEKPRQMSRLKPGEGKMQFSIHHRTHMSEAATRRWQRAREAAQATSAPNQQVTIGKSVGRPRNSEKTIHRTASYRRRHRTTRPPGR